MHFKRSAHRICGILVPVSLVAGLLLPASVRAQQAALHVPTNPGFLVVLDPAHGGNDPGARISNSIEEKNIALELAEHLRTLLTARGFTVIMTRTGDTDPDMTARAAMANHAGASACLILHATASGTGVHLFTSSLAPGPRVPAPDWSTAQAGYVNASIRLSSEIDAALTPTGIPVIVGRTFLRPLDNLTCPAVAVELAPLQSGGIEHRKAVNNPRYQTQVLNAIAAALVQWRQDWSGRS